MNQLWNAPLNTRGILPGAIAVLIFLSGCGGGTQPPPVDNTPPLIYDALITCDFDLSFLDYYWDFYAWVDDPDFNVTDVYVDVYDTYTGAFLETWDLVYDGGDQYSNRIYETYSSYLSCVFGSDFEFDIVAVDSYGEFDLVTVLP